MPLFPASSLDSSIVTSVLVGLLVVWFFTETLGWNFTGLVVPGYLASVFVIEPASGVVIVAEAVITWGVVEALSERVPAWWPWTPLFGRDRFFLFLLVSVAVRLGLEAGVLDELVRAIGVEVDGALHSMGLVLVPLMANAMWRSGAGGLVRVAVPVGVTWILLEHVLLRTTNLSLSSFELTYEDLALDFVSSPRAYLVLLVGAAMGSWVNQRWGWDFGGIVVPGLLALCWLEPWRLASTLGEAVAVAWLYGAATRAVPWLRNANLTGGRPLVLAFVLAYLLRFFGGWALVGVLPDRGGLDPFGFGYLLSSLVALRIVRHGELARSLVPATITSFVAFVVGSGAGYLLAVVLPGAAPADGVLPRPPGDEPRLAAVEAAWRDAGPIPPGVGVLAAGPAAYVTAGDGFGALWVRGEGVPLAVATRVGPLAQGDAALALARALDARAVLVCAAEGRGCPRAVDEIAVRMPVLWVEAGDRTTLAPAGAFAHALDLGHLGRLVGPYTVTATGRRDRHVLVLDPAARIRLAADAFGGATSPPPAAGAEATAAAEAAPADVAAVRARVEGVLRPLMEWRRGAPWAEPALGLAAGNARAWGMTVAREGPRVWVSGAGWHVLLEQAGTDAVVHVPRPADEPGALAAARSLAFALNAGALVADTSAGGDTSSGTTPGLAHAAVLALLGGADGDPSVVTVRLVPDTADPGGEVVLSLGRPASRDLPPVLAGLAETLGRAGLEVAVWDGAAQRLSFSDGGNPVREAARAAGGGESQVTAWIAPPVARRLSPLDDARTAQRVALAGLRTWSFAFADLEAWAAGAPATPADGLAAAVDAFTRTGRRAELDATRAGFRRRGAELALACERELGCRWIAVERCAEGVCEGALVPLVRPRPSATAPLRERLALGGGPIAYRRPTSAEAP
ncbi:MAG: poly-gamma-glutamate biosynthesis protein PgsC/CapC [Myxococcota bacterium]